MFYKVQERFSILSRDIKNIKRHNWNFLENAMLTMRNTLKKHSLRVNTTEEKISKLEDSNRSYPKGTIKRKNK